MKKIIVMALFLAFNVQAQTLESSLFDSVKPLGKLLEGKKGTVVLSTFKSSKSSETCAPSRGINSKISAALARANVKTVIASRAVSMDAEQAEISRVTKLSGGSYIILGTYEMIGTKLKIDCALYDSNAVSVGACADVEAVTVSADMADSINCPKEKVIEAPAKNTEEKIDSKKKVDE